jgi:hypothetical protein
MRRSALKGQKRARQKVQSTLGPKPGGGGRGRGPRQQRNIGQTNLGQKAVSAPSTIGIVIPSSYFRMDGKAQSLTDIGGMGDSARVCGCDLFGTAIKAGSSTAAAGFGSTATYWTGLTPSAISTRMQNLEELFQYYAFRKIRIIYSPEVPTSTAGSLALGVAQDNNVLAVSSPTQQQLLELSPAFKMPVWMTGSCEYTHSGTKVWETSTENSEILNNCVQLLLGCTLTGGVASTQYGTLWMEYVIDFYKPSMVLGSPSRVAKSLTDASCLRWSKFAERLRAELEFKDSSRKITMDLREEKKSPPLQVDDDYVLSGSTPRVPSDERKSEREASVERKPVASGGPRSGLFR